MMRFDLRLSQISFSISKQKQNVTKKLFAILLHIKISQLELSLIS